MGPSSPRRALSALIATGLALGGLVACNQILGTDKFSDGEEAVVDGSTFDGNLDDGSLGEGGTRDGGADGSVIIVLPPGAQPATWARWKMPDNLLGSIDGGPLQSYTKTPDGGVVDNVTLLTWSPTLGNAESFEDARDLCTKLGKWRLPTRIELVSIIDSTIPDSPSTPKINAIFDSKNGRYWTSSPVRPLTNPLVFWKVNFTATNNSSSIELPFNNTASGGYVRCVLGT